ncbi:unnamed protein product [Rotaria magnacalcarata]|uniref:Uncharacterized protein n=2 Tax=Rotaria magnacalcarata TaxID=392030 RepID=A0A816U1W5_9BILA|nr:unnamed protein product [Rotaria magnacalcarata]CAF1660261.1 unnamed protein product [Rotaria magnacalcarata]CAF2083778.1 unnamed protein product [Rotaria magnacalcarata]CAF2103326.1 unnamed protein product [Rotaria magnacalcarata]CAF2151234.1 unnamed protein product [Rotaria magnacalcarata]
MATSQNPKSSGTGKASKFYMACREGNAELVKRILKTMNVGEINKIEESNNSTALHAASYFGHPEVVKILLEHGGNTHTHNGYGNIPEQEATNEQVIELFRAYKNK